MFTSMIAILSSPTLLVVIWIPLKGLPSCHPQHRKLILPFASVICHPFFLYADLSIAAGICPPVFPSTELLSCLCLQWFAILPSPLLNCYHVSACSDLPSCLPLYWIAIMSLPALICNPVFSCIQNPFCKSLQWFAILYSPHWLVYHGLSLHFDYQSFYPCHNLSFFLVLQLSCPHIYSACLWV